MPGAGTALQSRGVRYVVGVAVLVVLFWFMPLFHVVSLEEMRAQTAAAVFNPVDFVDRFWQGPLLDAAGSAVDAAGLLAAFEQDFDAAVDRHGHRLGLSRASCFLVSGQGRITVVDALSVRISLGPDNQGEILIGTGPVFGNAIRDGSGLLDISDFANIQDFNAISAEINRRVEEQVLPVLDERGVVGAEVHFVGGVEVADTGTAPSSLRLVPVVIEFP